MAQLAPVANPIFQFNAFIAKQTEVLALKEKVLSLSGDSFDIKLSNGQPLLKIKGRHMTISGRKSVYDMSDTHLFDIKKEHLHIHSTYVAEDPNEKQFLHIKSAIKLFGSKATATFTGPDGKEHIFVMKGDWFDRSADIVYQETGAIVGRIDRQFLNARQLLGGQQTYALIVAPGVDMALMVALCIALDEKNNEK